jgi:phage terminase large subunit GpA-like protein
MLNAQMGKSSILRNVLGKRADRQPGPMLIGQPSIDMAEIFSKDRLTPFFRDTPVLSKLLKSNKTKDSGNSILHKKIPGGYITLVGAHSGISLASRPIAFIMLDEIDRYPFTIDGEGDPIELVIKRAANFWNRLIGLFSTPTDQRSRIAAWYERSDKRKFFVKCPHCKERILFLFPNLKWDYDKLKKEVSNIYYECPECDGKIKEQKKTNLVKKGKWIATGVNSHIAGFWINELYSPWRGWGEIILQFEAVKHNPDQLRVFINTVLAEVFEDKGDAPDHLHVYARREFYPVGTIPRRVLFLTAAADIQKDRIEIEVKGWARTGESWSIEHEIIMTDTSSPANLAAIDQIMNRVYLSECGKYRFKIKAIGVDTGYNTQAVYSYLRQRPSNMFFPLKGQTIDTAVSTPKAVDINFQGQRIQKGLKIWPVGVSILKSELYMRLKQEPKEKEDSRLWYPPGFLHFPDYPEEFFRQLTAESLVFKDVRGIRKSFWTKHYERNETLDLSVYNRAVTIILGMDRFNSIRWDEIERLAYNTVVETAAPSGKRTRRAPTKRRFSKGI